MLRYLEGYKRALWCWRSVLVGALVLAAVAALTVLGLVL